MSIDRVAVRLQSPSLPVASLTEIAGRPATRSTHRGTPVSSRRPEGPSHEVLGYMVELGADHLERLRAANCGIVFDVYSSIDDH